MSLVITSNRDSDANTPDGQSIYSAYSYRNEMILSFADALFFMVFLAPVTKSTFGYPVLTKKTFLRKTTQLPLADQGIHLFFCISTFLFHEAKLSPFKSKFKTGLVEGIRIYRTIEKSKAL